MPLVQKIAERRRCYSEMVLKNEEATEEFSMNNLDDEENELYPKISDPEKRIRREIANSNERRRMQSINTGFESLKTLLPHHEGEKLSKAAILQQTADYLKSLEAEKSRLLSQNAQLRRMIHEMTREGDVVQASPPPKRKKRDTECSDEGIGMLVSQENDDNIAIEEMKREVFNLRYQLEQERHTRMLVEEQTRSLEKQFYPERQLRQLASQVQAQIELQKEKERMYLEAHFSPPFRPVAAPTPQLPIEQPPQMAPPAPSVVQEKATFQQVSPIDNDDSLSRQRPPRLNDLVEAIRHVEGEQALDEKRQQQDRTGSQSAGEESGISTSDQEDTKSESSGRDSPIVHGSLSHMRQDFAIQAQTFQTKDVKYPIAMQLLFPSLSTQYLHRPGVIVHKSS